MVPEILALLLVLVVIVAVRLVLWVAAAILGVLSDDRYEEWRRRWR
jgi:cell shape-determining protein MreD